MVNNVLNYYYRTGFASYARRKSLNVDDFMFQSGEHEFIWAGRRRRYFHFLGALLGVLYSCRNDKVIIFNGLYLWFESPWGRHIIKPLNSLSGFFIGYCLASM